MNIKDRRRLRRRHSGFISPCTKAQKDAVAAYDLSSIVSDGVNYYAKDFIGKDNRPVQESYCYKFDGIDSYIDIPVNLNNIDVIEFKMMASSNGDYQTIIGQGNSGGTDFNSLQITNTGTIRFASTGGPDPTGTTNIDDGKWHDIKIYKGTNNYFKLELDGVLEIDSTDVVWFGSDPATDTNTIGCTLRQTLINPYNGYISNIKMYANNSLVAGYYCNETNGDKSYDNSGNNNHGTINNFVASTFHFVDNSLVSYHNLYGYATKTGVLGLIPLDSNSNPVISNTDKVYTGRVRYNALIKGSNCIKFNGTSSYINYNDTGFTIYPCIKMKFKTFDVNTVEFLASRREYATKGSEWQLNISNGVLKFIIFRYGGSTNKQVQAPIVSNTWYDLEAKFNGSKITLVLNGLEYTEDCDFLIKDTGSHLYVGLDSFGGGFYFSGIMNYIDLYNCITGELVMSSTFAEGLGNIAYNRVDTNNHGTINNMTESTFRIQDNEAYPNNLKNGFDLWERTSDNKLLRVPLAIDKSSIKTNGDTITGYTWVAKCLSGLWNNRSENTYNFPVSNALLNVDSGLSYLFNATPSSKQIGYDDKKYQVGNKIFSDARDYKWSHLLMYEEDVDNSKKNNIYKCISDPYLRDENYDIVTDENGDPILKD